MRKTRPVRTSRVCLKGKPEIFTAYIEAIRPKWLDRTLAAHAVQVMRFQRWVTDGGLALNALPPRAIDLFDQALAEQGLTRFTRATLRSAASCYLRWLADNGHLSLTPDELGANPKQRDRVTVTLPPAAEEYLSLIPAFKKAGTCGHIRLSLKRFYGFAVIAGIDDKALTLAGLEHYMVHLADANLCVQSRHTTFYALRAYFRWLHDHGHIAYDPEHLFQRVKLPKMPKFEPRPLQPEVDEALSKLLHEKEDLLYLGILLMRHSGIRIGELRNLVFQCVRTDIRGFNFLKVPLGKLDTERSVPIDDVTLGFIKKIQAISSANAEKNGISECPMLFLEERGSVPSTRAFGLLIRDLDHRLAASGITVNEIEKVVSHRLRHTYATTMLNAGMHLVGIKELLGHHSLRMTLRYAKIFDENVRANYFEALQNMKAPIDSVESLERAAKLGLKKAYSDVLLLLRERSRQAGPRKRRRVGQIIEQLEGLQRAINEFD